MNCQQTLISIIDINTHEQILGFGQASDKGFLEIHTQLSPEDLGIILLKVPAKLSHPLILALGRQQFTVPQLDKVLLENCVIPHSSTTKTGQSEQKQEASKSSFQNFRKKIAKAISLSKITKATKLQLKTPVTLDLQEIALYIPNALCGRQEIANEAGEIIMYFEMNSSQEFTAIESDISTEKFEQYLENVPGFLIDPLILSLENPSLVPTLALHAALRHSDLSLVDSLLQKLPKDKHTFANGLPYLYYAAQKGDRPLVQKLLAHKLPFESFQGISPLLIALQLKHWAVAEYLIQQGFDCSKALLYCAAHGQMPLIRLLIQKQTSHLESKEQTHPKVWEYINQKFEDEGDVTALTAASYFGHSAIVKYLLEKDALSTLSRISNKSELYWACKRGHFEVLNELLQYDFFYSPEEINDGLVCALENNHFKLLELLLQKGGDVNTYVHDNQRLLDYAVHNNFPACVEVLIQNGASLSSIDPWRLVDSASNQGYKEMVEILLRHPDLVSRQQNLPPSFNYHEVKKRAKSKTLSLIEINQNKTFALLFKNTNTEIAVRKLQHAHWKKHPPVKKRAFEETIKALQPSESKTSDRPTFPRFPLSFLQEPATGYQAYEHAKRIQEGRFLELNYDDPHFLRNLYKALRLNPNTLSVESIFTAYSIFQVKKLFNMDPKCIIKKHSYDGTGPYKVEDIHYATKLQLAAFYNNLATISPHEQCYFSVQCSQRFEFNFLSFALRTPCITPFKPIFLRFIDRINLSSETQKFLKKVFVQDSLTADQKKMFYSILTQYYPRTIRKNSTNTQTLEATAAYIIADIHYIDSQNPLVTLSPSDNPDDPLLCIIIPSIASFAVLEKTIHGQEHSVKPFFNVGPFQTRWIRKRDEIAQERPIEVEHPDLVHSNKPHDFNELAIFGMFAHDLFHVWQCGSLTIKDFLRYLIKLEESVTGYDMSKTIWTHVDRNYEYGYHERLHYKKKGIEDASFDRKYIIDTLLDLDLESKPDKPITDIQLIYLVDMAKKPETWAKLIGKTLERQYQDTTMLSKIHNMQEIIRRLPPNKPYILYILAYKLMNASNSFDPEAIIVLNQFAKNTDLLDRIFIWDRNQGLGFRKTLLCAGEKMGLIFYSPTQRVQMCSQFIQQLSQTLPRQTTIPPTSEPTVCNRDLSPGRYYS